MDCQTIRSELSAYLDNELPPTEQTLVASHLSECVHCQGELAKLKTLAAGVAALPRLEPPPRFLAEVRRKIAGGEKPLGKNWQDYLFRPLWLKIPLETVAALVIIAIVMSVERPVAEPKRADAGRESVAKTAAPALAADELRTKAWQAPRRSAVSATDAQLPSPAPAGSVVVAQSASTEAARQREPALVVEVQANDFEETRSQIQQITISMGGRFVSPPNREASSRTVFVELPESDVALFKSRLSQAIEPIRPAEGGRLAAESGAAAGMISSSKTVTGIGPTVLTGRDSSNLIAKSRSVLLGGSDRPAAKVILEIQVVPPKN